MQVMTKETKSFTLLKDFHFFLICRLYSVLDFWSIIVINYHSHLLQILSLT